MLTDRQTEILDEVVAKYQSASAHDRGSTLWAQSHIMDPLGYEGIQWDEFATRVGLR
jgi:hypothetical protein